MDDPSPVIDAGPDVVDAVTSGGSGMFDFMDPTSVDYVPEVVSAGADVLSSAPDLVEAQLLGLSGGDYGLPGLGGAAESGGDLARGVVIDGGGTHTLEGASSVSTPFSSLEPDAKPTIAQVAATPQAANAPVTSEVPASPAVSASPEVGTDSEFGNYDAAVQAEALRKNDVPYTPDATYYVPPGPPKDAINTTPLEGMYSWLREHKVPLTVGGMALMLGMKALQASQRNNSSTPKGGLQSLSPSLSNQLTNKPLDINYGTRNRLAPDSSQQIANLKAGQGAPVRHFDPFVYGRRDDTVNAAVGGPIGALARVQRMKSQQRRPQGGTPMVMPMPGRHPFSTGGLSALVNGPGGGQDDKIPAQLSDGEYVIDAATVSDLGDGSNDAGAAKLDQMRNQVRKHKRTGGKFPPKAKPVAAYLKGGK